MHSTLLIFTFVLAAGVLLLLVFRRRKSFAEKSIASPAGGDLSDKLSAARGTWVARLRTILTPGAKIDAALYQDLEETLVTSDIGIHTTERLLERLKQSVGKGNLQNADLLKGELQKEIFNILQKKSANANGSFDFNRAKPLVLVVVGVNGVGKTTTIGKLASHFQSQGKKVMLAAGDTFRAAAVEQLQIWGERAGVEVIAQKGGNSPAAVAFDAAEAARARGIDLLIVDTAGRFHTKENLMEELKKVCRILGKQIPGAPHEIFLVLDATTGQNALQQAKKFHEELGGISGIVLTKLDGTAKGGVLISLQEELGIPIRFIGVGEKATDLRKFDPKAYVDALFAE